MKKMINMRLLWTPIVGVPYLFIRTIKKHTLELYGGEFVLWGLYQSTIILVTIEIIKSNMKC